MPSEREIRKLYVNVNHLHRVFLLLISNFQRPQGVRPSPKVVILEAFGG